jgi:hypothetical protein
VGRDIEDIVGVCESEQRSRWSRTCTAELLKALSRERQELYQQLGEALARGKGLASEAPPSKGKRRKRNAEPCAAAERETEDA